MTTAATPKGDSTEVAVITDAKPAKVTAKQQQAKDRAEQIRVGLGDFAEVAKLITKAYSARDWLSLGYADWQSYVTGEYGKQITAISKSAQKIMTIQLADAGMSTRAIAPATGQSQSAVQRQVNRSDSRAKPRTRTRGTDGKSYSARTGTRTRTTKPPTVSSVTLVTPEPSPEQEHASAEAIEAAMAAGEAATAMVELQQRASALVREVKAVAGLVAKANGDLTDAARIKVAGWLGDVAEAAASAEAEVRRHGQDQTPA